MVNMLFICLICALLIVGFMRDGIDQEGEIKRGPSSPATREKQLEVVSDAAAALGDLSRRPTVYNLTFTPVVFLVFRPLRPIFLSSPRRLNLFFFFPLLNGPSGGSSRRPPKGETTPSNCPFRLSTQFNQTDPVASSSFEINPHCVCLFVGLSRLFLSDFAKDPFLASP